MAKKVDTRTEEEKRSYTMSRIKGKATSIEVMLQKALWHRGVRYRKNYKKAPGSPDIAIVKYKIAVFCDGEFWHGKNWERTKSRLKNNRDYWIRKIERNMERDSRFDRELAEQGWHVLHFWGNEIKSDIDACVEAVLDCIRSIDGKVLYIDTVSDVAAAPLMVAEKPDGSYSAGDGEGEESDGTLTVAEMPDGSYSAGDAEGKESDGTLTVAEKPDGSYSAGDAEGEESDGTLTVAEMPDGDYSAGKGEGDGT